MDPEGPRGDSRADRRRCARMVRDQLDDCGDERVRAAMAAVPRHRFVPRDFAARAYEDQPLAIGAGQTISQPRVVAYMLARLAVAPGHRVLDVGSGSGYVSALLAQLAAADGEVVAVERQPALLERSRVPLAELYTDELAAVELRLADAGLGCAERAPFDRIHVACACPTLPEALVEQLAPGGRMILPLGAAEDEQELLQIDKDEDGELRRERLWAVRFVPLRQGVAEG